LFAAVEFLSPRDYLFVSASGVIAGNVLCGVGLLVIALAFASLRSAIQIAPEPKPGAQLVETGVYKYLRHPIYSGIIFCVVGLFLRQPTVWMAIAVAMVIIFLFFKARLEEKLLLSVYPGYATYRSRTWGLLPGLHY
jgi:protein-S-isoprenylcysteine O-methyltransferase Ste14